MNVEVAAAFVLDWLVGDPQGLVHPVVLIGSAISRLEAALRSFCKDERQERAMGAVLAAAIVAGSYIACRWVIIAAGYVHPVIGTLLSLWLTSTTIAAKGLSKAAYEVAVPLGRGDLEAARKSLGMIVGRDTQDLPLSEIGRGAVETVAENTCDGVIAPLFYAFIGGAPLAMAYKAVNTLDSMVGYKNARYLHFGRASAKLDDVVNYMPARLSGFFLVVAAFLGGHDWRRAFSTVLSDSQNNPSPNSGVGEAAVAGALGVRLGGENRYGGVPSFRGYMGEPLHPISADDVRHAVKLMYIASVCCVVAGTTVSALLWRAAIP